MQRCATQVHMEHKEGYKIKKRKNTNPEIL